MGMQFLIEARTMKFLGVLALAAIACAEPEAKAKANPAYWYGNYWGAWPASYGSYRSYASPYWGGYYNRGYGYWKRDADSNRNYFYNPYNSNSWGMDMYSRNMDKHTEMNHRQMDMNSRQMNNMGMNQMPYQWNMNNMGMNNMQMNNRNMMQYNRNNMYYQGSRFFKREAEADAEPAYWYGNFYNGNQWGYSGWYNRPYGYNWGYSSYMPYGGSWW